MNYRASYDVLALLKHLGPSVGGADEAELHVFAYLSCLMSVYAGQPAAEWGYDFISSAVGAPFAEDLDAAISWSANVGYIHNDRGTWKLTASGAGEFVSLSTLRAQSRRLAFIEPACASTLSIPVGWVRRGLDQTPPLKSAASRENRRYVSDETALDAMYDHFAALRRVIRDDVTDLLVPAVVWLEYLADSTFREGST